MKNFTSHRSDDVLSNKFLDMGAWQTTDDAATCVPLPNTEEPGMSPIYVNSHRIRENKGEPVTKIITFPEVTTVAGLITSCAEKYTEYKCLGERAMNPDGTYAKYNWITYGKFGEMAVSFATRLIDQGIKPGDHIGLYSHNCSYWHIANAGIYLAGAVCVPIADNLSPGSERIIITSSNLTALIVHNSKLLSIKHIYDEISIKFTVVIAREMKNKDNFYSAKDFALNPANHELPEVKPEDMATILYTGDPDGGLHPCPLTHSNLIAGTANLTTLGASITTGDVLISFLPLSHSYALCTELLHLAQGAAIGFYTGDIRNLDADIKRLHPTVFVGVPRVFNRFFEQYEFYSRRLGPVEKAVHRVSFSFKSSLLARGMHPPLLLDLLIFRRARESLGGRVRFIVCGGAPIRSDVFEFLRVCVTPNVILGYGLTEASASGALQEVSVGSAATVGAVSVGLDLRLRAVPGLAYDPHGTPRSGEVLLRGAAVCGEGGAWLATGDIGSVTPDGRLQILDRLVPSVKLSHGESMSVTALQAVYASAPAVAQVFLFADPHHSRPVAVVVPASAFAEEWRRAGVTDLAESQSAAQAMVELLSEVAEREHLRPFERVAGVILSEEPLTGSYLIVRSKFEGRLLELYARIDHESE